MSHCYYSTFYQEYQEILSNGKKKKPLHKVTAFYLIKDIRQQLFLPIEIRALAHLEICDDTAWLLQS